MVSATGALPMVAAVAVAAGAAVDTAVAPGAATSAPALIFSFMHPLPGTHVHPGVAMHFFMAYDEGDFLTLVCLLFLPLDLGRRLGVRVRERLGARRDRLRVATPRRRCTLERARDLVRRLGLETRLRR